MRITTVGSCALVALLGASPLAAQGPAGTPQGMKAQLDEARAQIAEQRRQLDAQEQRLRALEARLNQAPAPAAGPPQRPPAALARQSSASTPGDPATIQQSALAQAPVERVGRAPAGSDRPPEVAVLGQEGSVVTRRGQLTAEAQVDYARADRNRALFRGIEVVESVLVGEFNINENRQDIISTSASLRYGLTDTIEVGVRVPVVARWDRSVLVPVQGSTGNDAAREIDSSVSGQGLGDVELSLRYQFLTGRPGVPFLVGNLQVVAPTGSNPFNVPRRSSGEALKAATGAGFWGVSPSITAVMPSDPAVLFGTIGYTRNFGRSVDAVIAPVQIDYVKPGDALTFSAGIGIALNDRASINLGYAHAWAFGTRTRTRLLEPGPSGVEILEDTSRDLQIGRLLFGVTYRVTDRSSINWSVEVGATDDAADVRNVLRIPLVLLSPR